MRYPPGRMSRQPPRLDHQEPDFAVGSFDSIYCVVWRNDTTVQGAKALHEGFHRWAKPGARHGLVTIIQANAPLPASDARDEVASFLRSIGDLCVVSAVVFEGSGFKSAAVRGVVTGLTIMARQPYPHRVFATVEEASGWYAEHAPDEWGLTPSGFRERVASLRRLITPV